MDIKEKVQEIVEKMKANPALMKEFEKEPVKTLEKILEVDLPDEIVEALIDGVKANVTLESVSKMADAFKKLF